jgi:hypothetical protein
MKFPTSIKSAQAAINEASNSLDMYKDAVQPVIEEPVLAACLFSRQGTMANKLAGHFGALPYMLAKKHAEMKAGGLPEHFILAVTDRTVYAIEQKISARNPIGETRGEVARWNREAIDVSWTSDRTTGGLTLNVTIESPVEGETVQCCVGNSPLSEEFLSTLAGNRVAA